MEQGKNMATSPTSQYAIIKVRFKAVDTNTFGFFLLFMDNETRRYESVTVLVSHFSSLYEIDPKENWSSLEERLMELKWKGEYAATISRDTQTSIEAALNGLRSEEICNFVKSNNTNKIASLLAMVLAKPLGDKNVFVDLAWDNVSKAQIEEVKQEREQRSAEQAAAADAASAATATLSSGNEFGVEDGSVVLNVNFVLSPVSGVPIHELKMNDKIMVKIDPSSKRGMYFIELLNAKQDDKILPVPGTVTDIKIGKNNEYSILVKIGEGIYGNVSEAEKVKIKRFDPETDGKTASNIQANLKAAGYAAKGAEKTSGLQWVLYIGGFLLLGVLLLIVTTL